MGEGQNVRPTLGFFIPRTAIFQRRASLRLAFVLVYDHISLLNFHSTLPIAHMDCEHAFTYCRKQENKFHAKSHAVVLFQKRKADSDWKAAEVREQHRREVWRRVCAIWWLVRKRNSPPLALRLNPSGNLAFKQSNFSVCVLQDIWYVLQDIWSGLRRKKNTSRVSYTLYNRTGAPNGTSAVRPQGKE